MAKATACGPSFRGKHAASQVTEQSRLSVLLSQKNKERGAGLWAPPVVMLDLAFILVQMLFLKSRWIPRARRDKEGGFGGMESRF